MPLASKTSSAARMSLIYITVGALTVIWTAVWYLYLRNHPPETTQPYYWLAGLLGTGIVLVGIGLAVGRIGRSAKRADNPPQVVVPPAPAPTATVVPTAAPANVKVTSPTPQ